MFPSSRNLYTWYAMPAHHHDAIWRGKSDLVKWGNIPRRVLLPAGAGFLTSPDPTRARSRPRPVSGVPLGRSSVQFSVINITSCDGPV